jgi:murein L,D-transpeptidase YafK
MELPLVAALAYSIQELADLSLLSREIDLVFKGCPVATSAAKCIRLGLLVAITSTALAGCFGASSNESETALPQTPKIIEPKRTDPWVLIDSATDQLIVYRRKDPPIVFNNIAFGAAGVKDKLRSGDDVTPRGTYTIGWIKRESKFATFIGLTYPSLADAERGYQRGVITQATFEQIRDAHTQGRIPPQNTRLGGFIGIHGVGKGSLDIHRIANWTAGCIAVENRQIEQLVKLVGPGTHVEIR